MSSMVELCFSVFLLHIRRQFHSCKSELNKFYGPNTALLTKVHLAREKPQLLSNTYSVSPTVR